MIHVCWNEKQTSSPKPGVWISMKNHISHHLYTFQKYHGAILKCTSREHQVYVSFNFLTSELSNSCELLLKYQSRNFSPNYQNVIDLHAFLFITSSQFHMHCSCDVSFLFLILWQGSLNPIYMLHPWVYKAVICLCGSALHKSKFVNGCECCAHLAQLEYSC